MKNQIFIVLLIISILLSLTGCTLKNTENDLDPIKPTVTVTEPEPKPEPKPQKPEMVTYPITEITEPVPIPVLMYHAFTQDAAEPDGYFVNVQSFENQLIALKDAGYTTITPHQLDAFMEKKSGLPEKPIIITMDDGYDTTLSLAAPILKKHGMNATVFAIGISIDNEVHPNTGKPFLPPRFDWMTADQWVNEGVIEIQSHTYDLHKRSNGTEGERDGVLMKKDEPLEEYTKALIDDFDKNKNTIESNLDTKVISIAYPFGLYSDIASAVLAAKGAKIQFTSEIGCTSIMPVENYSFIKLKRWSIGDNITGQMLIERLDEMKQSA